jgi:hypothetical protein
MDIDKLEICGEKLSDSIINFEKSFLPNINYPYDNIKLVCGGQCKVCQSTLNYILKRHEKELENLDLPMTICIGKGIKMPKPKKRKAFICPLWKLCR